MWNPLEKRVYKYRNAAMEFFCPLCSTKRAINTSHRLSFFNYFQIAFLACLTTAIVFPLTGFKGLFSFFLYWPAFELVKRYHFKKEIPCPHCGFDASWYKRDVPTARRKVEEFWKASEQSEEDSGPLVEPEVSA